MFKNKFVNFWQNTFKRQFWQIKSNLLLSLQILKMTLGFKARTSNKLSLCNWKITSFFSQKSVLFPQKMIKCFLRNYKVLFLENLWHSSWIIWALRLHHTHSEGGWLIDWNKRIKNKNLKNQIWVLADSVRTKHDRGHLLNDFTFEVISLVSFRLDSWSIVSLCSVLQQKSTFVELNSQKRRSYQK